MRKKHFSKDDILRAMRHTKSVRAAARYLGTDYLVVRAFFKMYKDEKTGKSLFELHLNRKAIGIPKHFKGGSKQPSLESILNSEVDWKNFPLYKLKERLIFENYLVEECNICKFNERRVHDYKIPLLLNFKNGNRNHFVYDNLELLCYNCYFLRVGNMFDENQNQSGFLTKQQSKEIPKQSYHDDDINEIPELNSELEENMKSMGIEI